MKVCHLSAFLWSSVVSTYRHFPWLYQHMAFLNTSIIRLYLAILFLFLKYNYHKYSLRWHRFEICGSPWSICWHRNVYGGKEKPEVQLQVQLWVAHPWKECSVVGNSPDCSRVPCASSWSDDVASIWSFTWEPHPWGHPAMPGTLCLWIQNSSWRMQSASADYL